MSRRIHESRLRARLRRLGREAHLTAPGVVFVEVDEDTSAYDKGHIPGAVRLDWKSELQDPVQPRLRRQGAVRGAAVRARASPNDDTVVLYGGNNNWFAAYAYWYFKLVRPRRRPAARRWPQEVGARRPRADHRGARPPGDPVPASEARTDIRAFRDEVIAAIGEKNLVDVRSPDEFSGSCSPRRTCRRSSRSGPATSRPRKNIPWAKAANEDGTFKSDDELTRALRARPASTSRKDTIAYCRIGERSAHTWFVLHELLGLPNVKNYDGSWTEYGSLVGVPIEKGA